MMLKLRKQGKQGKQAKRKQPAAQPASFQWRKSYNWIFLLVPILLGGFYLERVEQLLPIRTIQLSGKFDNLDQQAVAKVLQQYIGQGFFSLNMSDSAIVYPADTGSFSHLPVVHAANHQPAWVLEQFYRLEAQFISVDERLMALHADSRGALDLELINGLQIKLGRGSIDHKIDRLVSIYQQQILPRREQIQRLDLRYSNGFAVAWKKEALQASDKASIWSNSNV
jgi:cell division septal protein FtsQ